MPPKWWHLTPSVSHAFPHDQRPSRPALGAAAPAGGAHDRRSLNREVIHLLERVLAEAPAAPGPVAWAEQIEAQVRMWHALAGRWAADREPTEEIGAL